jgi:hypothetical protein
MTEYTPREGSTAYLAIQHLQAHGPAGELALASAIDKEVHELRPLLGWAQKVGAISSEKVGDEWVYRLGDGEPVAAQTPAAPSKNTPKGDQPRFERGREGMEPEACESADGRGTDGRGTDGAPALATLPHNASPVGGPMGAGQPAAAGPIEAAKPQQIRIALWSDGELHLQRSGGEEIRFSRGEAKALVGYLDSIALDMLREEATA